MEERVFTPAMCEETCGPDSMLKLIKELMYTSLQMFSKYSTVHRNVKLKWGQSSM